MTLRFFSYGGGVQSTAALVLAARGEIDFPTFVMANVGDDSEDPATLDYLNDHAIPFADQNGIELVVLSKMRKGEVETLYGKLTRPGSKSTSIPYRSKPDGPPMSRSCTVEFKMRVLGKEARRRGATEENPAIVGIGFSLDEITRATTRKAQPWERLVYPLIGLGEETGLKLRRNDCMKIIADAGLPVPPKSSCYFCPFHSLPAWADLARDRPELFEKAADLETHLRDRSLANGTGPVFLTRLGIPLRRAVQTDQDTLPADPFDGMCDTGYCST